MPRASAHSPADDAIVAMGFTRKRAETALNVSNGSFELAVAKLLKQSAGRDVLAAALAPAAQGRDGWG